MLAWLLLLGLEPSAGTWLDVHDCPELDRAHLLELTGLELDDAPTRIRGEIHCRSAGFEISLRRDDGEVLRRQVPAASEAPERYLAVEVVELVELLQSEARPPTPAEPPPSPLSAPPPQPTSAAPSGRLWLGGSARFELGGDPRTPAGGLQLTLGGPLWRRLELRAHLSALAGARRLGADSVRLGRLLGGAALVWVVPTARIDLPIGGGARLGGVWLQGRSDPTRDPGRTHRGLAWSPFVSFGVRGPKTRRSFADLDLQLGWAVRTVRGLRAERVVVTTGGPWLGVSLGLGGWVIR